MKPLFAVQAVDQTFYEQRLRDWLPDKIIDIHTHLWRNPPGARAAAQPSRSVTWPARVAAQNPLEDLVATYELLFPGKQVTPLMFASAQHQNLRRANAYVARSARRRHFPALIYSHPRWSANQLLEEIEQGGFLGAKSYLSLAEDYLPAGEIRIYDFFPPHQLAALNRRGLILMLHIPRAARLRDPVNLAQLLEIEERYPRLQVIVAHVGRAYCRPDIGAAFQRLAGTKRLLFDISANTNAEVFRELLRAVGPRRVLFGSDLPITRMRMRRICEGGRYVNLVPRGLYGNLAGDKNMRALSGAAAQGLTFFLYEELDAFRRAAKAERLTQGDIQAVFHDNAAALLASAAKQPPQQLRMVYPAARRIKPRDLKLPPGYQLRTYRADDAEAYIRLMRRAGFRAWNKDTLQELLRRILPGGIFFIVHQPSGALVATASALHHPQEQHPSGGELGWVACDPKWRGRGLGRIVCAAALKRFQDAGYRELYLLTDDIRLAAIHIYLEQGWKPLLCAPDMAARWQAVLQQLNLKKEVQL